MIELKINYPVYMVLAGPYRQGAGYSAKMFANMRTQKYDSCLAVFNDEIEAEEFIDRYNLHGGTIQEIQNESEFKSTCKNAKRAAKFTHVAWNYPGFDDKLKGELCCHPIDW